MSFWTDERVARLEELWDRGYSAALIADFLKTSRGAVVGKAWRLELPERRVLYTKQVKPRRRGRPFVFRPRAPKINPPPKSRHSGDFSWHLRQVSLTANFRDVLPPVGAPSWRTFTRWRAGNTDLQAAYMAARTARNTGRDLQAVA